MYASDEPSVGRRGRRPRREGAAPQPESGLDDYARLPIVLSYGRQRPRPLPSYHSTMCYAASTPRQQVPLCAGYSSRRCVSSWGTDPRNRPRTDRHSDAHPQG